MYADGDGVPKDAVLAVKWFRRSAEQGLPEAQYNLGMKYFRGEGLPNDAVLAVKWFRNAAEQGLVIAQSILGLMYARGEGVPKDPGGSSRLVERRRCSGQRGSEERANDR